MTPSTILINAARGEVVDTKALLDAISHRRLGHTIIDVWENEPDIPWDLFQAVTIGTPHIAGHSLDGKANGTFMIYQAVCKHLGVPPVWNPAHSLPPPVVSTLEFDIDRITGESIPAESVSRIYDLEADYLRMHGVLQAPAADRPKLFDGLRKNYPVRREFQTTRLILPKLDPSVRTILTGIGFSNITGKW
jgi:erythronate-4-phosphate dehydrogenase